jgi:hypothetical protein
MTSWVRAIGIGVCVWAMGAAQAGAHCDAVDGPVVKAARAALERGDVSRVLPWVSASAEAEVRAAYDQARTVRAGGGAAAELADRWFFETVVRIHRQGEGAPFDGLKPAGQIAHAVAVADQSLERRSVDDLVKAIASEAEHGLHHRYEAVQAAAREASSSVEAGRRYVAAYVQYVHYVEALHGAVSGAGAHAEGAAPGGDAKHPAGAHTR